MVVQHRQKKKIFCAGNKFIECGHSTRARQNTVCTEGVRVRKLEPPCSRVTSRLNHIPYARSDRNFVLFSKWHLIGQRRRLHRARQNTNEGDSESPYQWMTRRLDHTAHPSRDSQLHFRLESMPKAAYPIHHRAPIGLYAFLDTLQPVLVDKPSWRPIA